MMNSSNFHTQQYEAYMSIFGKKVLRNLINNLVERNERNKIQVRGRNTCGQNRKVLNFGNTYISPFIITYPQKALINESDNYIFGYKSTSTDPKEVKSPVATSSQGLLKTATGNRVNEKEDTCIGLKNSHHLSTSELTVIDDCSNEKLSDNMEWDDIFDTKLLNRLNILETDSNINSQKDITENRDSILLHSENENELYCRNMDTKTLINFDMQNKINSDYGNMLHHPTGAPETNALFYSDNLQSEISEITDVKKVDMKRANSNKITNVIPKKVKNLPLFEIPKHTFRKQKYTKAVKTWLSNVEHENIMVVQRSKERIAKGTIAESSKQEPKKITKKTVQALLTNKGGVMKFAKPIHSEVSEKLKVIDPLTKYTSKFVQITGNEKKAKPKFMTPIKSQIPVKNITYNIINLNNDSFKNHGSELNSVNDTEINMILTFSNGFCQLNSNNTEETCVTEGVMFEINHVIYYWNHNYKTFCDVMGKVINHNIIVCYDGKSLLKYFTSQCDIKVISTEVKILDLQIGGNLIDPNNTPENFTSLQKLLSHVPEYTVASECAQQKCAWWLTVLDECLGKLKSLLVDSKLWNVFIEIEMAVLPIIAEMEQSGIRVDTERLKTMENSLIRRIQATERACHAAAGRFFQVNSTPQVRGMLYDELRLDVKGDVRVRETVCKGDKSTSEVTLRSLMAVHPLPRLILEYRHVYKAHATFVAGIASQVKDGIVTPTWEQIAAVTGRIACKNPNLQAIPKTPFSLMLFPADSNEEELLTGPNDTINFRSVYIPREGHMLLAADFKHIECRVFAYAAADTSLLDALTSPDLFRVLAARWLNKSEQEVSSDERDRTKRMVYASLYGAGIRRLAEILGFTYDRTLTVVASFNRTFPSLKSFGRAVAAKCVQCDGRLTTLCGRGRSFPNMFSGDLALKSQAERQAVNFIVQGTAADLCKLAMVRCARRLRAAAVRATLLLQVHDELVWEVPQGDVVRAAAEIKSAMEGVGWSSGVAVPLPVALAVGHTWGATEEYTPPPCTPPILQRQTAGFDNNENENKT